VKHINQLVGNLVGQYAGPILVVGGAPGVPEELEVLRAGGFDLEKCLIISANEHAMHAGLKPHFACVNDDVHSTLNVYQEPRIRGLLPDTKLLSRHWWADYRSPQLMACNSGLKALMYAAILGANPVIVIGIQNYSNGLYFHEDHGKKSNPNLLREASYFSKQVRMVQQAMQGVPVRTISGPLTHTWPKWNPREQFDTREQCQLERKALDDAAHGRYVCTMLEAVTFEGALIPLRTVFAVTKGELLAWGRSDAIQDATGWDLNKIEAELEATYEQRRAERARLQQLIAKVRNSRRGISRSIYDADILRIIRWTEAGQTPAHIAKRTGMPKEQVQFMVKTMGLDNPVGHVLPCSLQSTPAREAKASAPGDPGVLPP
jgi:hypothetical protein